MSGDLLSDERGDTASLGVLILLGMTVVMASVAGAYTFDFADRTPQPMPTTALESEYDGEELIVTSVAGDSIKTEYLRATSTAGTVNIDAAGVGDELEVGESIRVTGEVGDDVTVRIVWEPQTGDRGYVLREIQL